MNFSWASQLPCLKLDKRTLRAIRCQAAAISRITSKQSKVRKIKGCRWGWEGQWVISFCGQYQFLSPPLPFPRIDERFIATAIGHFILRARYKKCCSSIRRRIIIYVYRARALDHFSFSQEALSAAAAAASSSSSCLLLLLLFKLTFTFSWTAGFACFFTRRGNSIGLRYSLSPKQLNNKNRKWYLVYRHEYSSSTARGLSRHTICMENAAVTFYPSACTHIFLLPVISNCAGTFKWYFCAYDSNQHQRGLLTCFKNDDPTFKIKITEKKIFFYSRELNLKHYENSINKLHVEFRFLNSIVYSIEWLS